MCTSLPFCFRDSPLGQQPQLKSQAQFRVFGSLCQCLRTRNPRPFLASGLIERTLRPLSFSLLHPAHVEKHLLNSGRLRGLMPTHTEKQTVLNTHREAHRYKRTHTGTSPDKNHTRINTQRRKSTRIPRNAQRYSRHTQLTETLDHPAMQRFTVPLGAHTQRHATLDSGPRDSPGAQPQPTQAAPPSEEASLRSLLLPRLKMY